MLVALRCECDGRSTMVAEVSRRRFPKPMSAAEELTRAQELVHLRRWVWVCLLGYPPFAQAIVAYIESELGEHAPTQELEQMRCAAASVRELETRDASEHYAAARERLAEALHVHHDEAPLVRALHAEIRSIAARRFTTRPKRLLDVRTPSHNSQAFRRYLVTVDRAESELTRARQRFVAANLRLVVSLARRFRHTFLTQADLIQEGTLGLLRAVDGYDPTRGTRFSTYAAWWIKHGITRALANHGLTVRVPAHVLGLRAQLSRAARSFTAEHGRSPSDSELSGLLEVSSKAVGSARRAGPVVDELSDAIVDEEALDLDAVLDQPVVVGEMVDALERLPGIEGAVIRKRFALDGEEPMTLAELGEVHCLSRERIRQIEKQALKRMRGELRSRGIVAGV
jgi:RNA polymerase primary sigma factor